MKISKQTQNEINKWQKLKEHEGFELLTKELEKMVKDAERIIFALGTDSKKEFSKRDIAIIKRDNAMELKELPDMMIKQLSSTGTQPHDDPDPYSEQKNEEIDNETEKIFKDDLNN